MIARLVRLLALAILGFTGAWAADDQNPGTCQLITLRGAYGFTSTGELTGPGARFAAVGRQEFDGRGHYAVLNTISVGGKIMRWLAPAGTYTVNPDCTGTMSSFGSHLDFVIVDKGKQVYVIAAVEGQIITAVYTRL